VPTGSSTLMLHYQRRLSLNRHTKNVSALAFHPEGLLLASGASDEWVYIWSTKTGEVIHAFEGNSAVLCITWSTQGNALHIGLEDGMLVTLVMNDVAQVTPTWLFSQYRLFSFPFSTWKSEACKDITIQ
jgi:WD40 repeat protein